MAAIAQPGTSEHLAVVDDYPDRRPLGPPVISDGLDVDLELAVQFGQRLSIELRRRLLLGQ